MKFVNPIFPLSNNRHHTKLLATTLLLMIGFTGFSQQKLHVGHGCAFNTSSKDVDLYTFEPSEEAERIVSEICNAMGVSPNFDVRSSNVENALATTDGPRRIILYSTIFLKKFNEDARTRWAAYSVMAHEIGHHFSGHDFSEPNPGKRKQMELEADRFSGAALRLLGADLDEAKAGIETFALQVEQAKHPSAKARQEALANGWNQMQERLAKMGAVIPDADSNIPRERDTDGDGIADKNDACPEEYGRTLTAGCPDGDEDGIPDSEDQCKYLKGPSQWKGCPDTDGDGIPDHEDRCPKEPGYVTEQGCPPVDRDGDKVTDRADKCPDDFGLIRYQGCPDTDGDGVPDPEDYCPKEKGDPIFKGCVSAIQETPLASLPLSTLKTTLHVVSVGVPVENSGIQYSQKDAKDIAQLFLQQEGKLYQKVTTTVLTSKDSTRAGAIYAVLKNFRTMQEAGQLKPTDAILIFISGHGRVSTEDGQFRLLGSDFDQGNEKYTSLSYTDEILSILERLDCQAFVLLDAAHSGAALIPKNASESLNSGAKNVCLVTSSKRNEASYESPFWQNGAFTKALKDVLSSRKTCTELDTDGNRYLSINELIERLATEVQGLMRARNLNMTQTPSISKKELKDGKTAPFWVY